MPLSRIKFAAALLLPLTIAAMTGTVAYYGTQSTVPSGFTADGWSSGGLSLQQFTEQLAGRLDAIHKQQVALVDDSGVSHTFTFAQLGITAQTDELNGQLARLLAGSLFSRAQARWELRKKQMPVSITFNEQTMNETLAKTWPQLYSGTPVDARRIVQDDDTIGYTPEQPVRRVDAVTLTGLLQKAVPTVGQADGHSGAPAPAAVKLPIITQSPAITVATLKAEGVERKLVEYTTTYMLPNSTGRAHNIRSTAAAIQDVVLKPNEIFDYSAYIKLTEQMFGYQNAPVIVNGKLVPGIGGGICQVSTTLYNAVLRSGLKVVERRNHSLPISYAPLGQDATFASGFINFRFQNTTGSHLLIRTSATDNRVTVKLFGTAPANVTYDVESHTVETIPPPTKYVHNPKLPTGKTELIGAGKPGYVVETYRIKKVDGREAARTLVSKDTYSPQPILMGANTGSSDDRGNAGPSRNSPAPIVEDGIKGPLFR